MPDAGSSLEQGVDAMKSQLDAARPPGEAPSEPQPGIEPDASDPSADAPIDAHIAELAAELTAQSSDPATAIVDQVQEGLDEAAQAVEAVKQAAEDLMSAAPAEEPATPPAFESVADTADEPAEDVPSEPAASEADAAPASDPLAADAADVSGASEPVHPADAADVEPDAVPGAVAASPEIESLDRELAQLADDMVAGEVSPASPVVEASPEPTPTPDPEPEPPAPQPVAPAAAPAPPKPAPPPAPKVEPKRRFVDVLGPLGLRLATALAAPLRGLPAAKRAVIGYIAIYTLFLGACASAYVLVFRSSKPPAPIEAVHETTDLHEPKPTYQKRTFYSPDDPSAPKPEAGGGGHGAKDDGHGVKKDDAHGAKKDDGHGKAKSSGGH